MRNSGGCDWLDCDAQLKGNSPRPDAHQRALLDQSSDWHCGNNPSQRQDKQYYLCLPCLDTPTRNIKRPPVEEGEEDFCLFSSVFFGEYFGAIYTLTSCIRKHVTQSSLKISTLSTYHPLCPSHPLCSQNAKQLRQWDPITVWLQQRSSAEYPAGPCFLAGSFTYKTDRPICLCTGCGNKVCIPSLEHWGTSVRSSAQGEINNKH